MWCNIKPIFTKRKKGRKQRQTRGKPHWPLVRYFSVLWCCEFSAYVIWRICSSDSCFIKRFTADLRCFEISFWKQTTQKGWTRMCCCSINCHSVTYTDLTHTLTDMMWTVLKEIESLVWYAVANADPPLEVDAFAQTPLTKSLFYAFPSFHLIPLLMHRVKQQEQHCDAEHAWLMVAPTSSQWLHHVKERQSFLGLKPTVM